MILALAVNHRAVKAGCPASAAETMKSKVEDPVAEARLIKRWTEGEGGAGMGWILPIRNTAPWVPRITAPFQKFDPPYQTRHFGWMDASCTTPTPRRLLTLSLGASAGTK